MLCCIVYLIPSYVMTGQPMELMRFSYFTIFAIVTSLTSQSTGFFYGATLPVKVSFSKCYFIFIYCTVCNNCWRFSLKLFGFFFTTDKHYRIKNYGEQKPSSFFSRGILISSNKNGLLGQNS